MAAYRVGIVGCGRRVLPDGTIRRGMAFGHAKGYLSHRGAQLVAMADIKPDSAKGLAADLGAEVTVYDDFEKMLAHEDLDIVSVCTWPAFHAEMVIAAAAAGVKAVHSEKPMAPTWGEAKRMVAACEDAGVQLTIGHQRRFNLPFKMAKKLVGQGRIGKLQRLEAQCPNLMDWGTHWFNMLFFYNDDQPAAWVIGQIDKRTDLSVFQLQHEDQGISLFGFQNGVTGYLETGPKPSLGAQNRLIGETGVIEVGAPGNVPLRWRSGETEGWELPDCQEGLHGLDAVAAGVHDAIDSLLSDRTPVLSARTALQSTEVIFATYESSRRRARVDLPLAQEDSALLTMLADGTVGPKPEAP
ncbi:MAG: Gfo/Idh/MocA family oxidoreductase [Armatimonadetes bacterium]|nr:Gfo/Idh/MocA family oxidoreductase [Armatimonadota bacterium]